MTLNKPTLHAACVRYSQEFGVPLAKVKRLCRSRRFRDCEVIDWTLRYFDLIIDIGDVRNVKRFLGKSRGWNNQIYVMQGRKAGRKPGAD